MAKINDRSSALQELKTQIKEKKLGRLYVFHGEEVFLLKHYLSQIQKKLLDPLTESFNYHPFNQETFQVQAFLDSVENMPMMAEATLVVVEDIDLFKLPEEQRNKIGAQLADIPEWCTVIFTYETENWKPDKRLTKLWKPIDENGLIVEFAKQDQRDLVAWIGRHFAAHKKRIPNDLCVYLIEITGGTMTALRGEIAKICAYSGADEICKADIDAVTEPVLEAVVFQLTDLMNQGRYDKALEKLQTLLKMQESPIMLLGAIGGHYRRIATARTLLDHGKNSSDLEKLCGIKDYAARKTMEAARRYSNDYCARAAELIVETDYKMKTSFDDQERLLELLVLQLAQEARTG